MFSKVVLTNLKKAGHKITAPRVEILEVLSAKTPVNSQEVFEILKRKGTGVDLVTVYRTLELFKNLGFINKTKFEDGVARYELINEDEHHHHLVCIKCGDVEDVEINEDSPLKQIEKKSKFKVERHSLEFFGFCKKCQS